MIEIYTHDLGGESSQELLAAYGIIAQADPEREMLQPKYCTNCREPNKHDARFCANSRCGMPLTFEAYESMKEKQQEKENDITRLKQDVEELRELLKDPKKLQELQKENEQEDY
jgi:hypothetical protein